MADDNQDITPDDALEETNDPDYDTEAGRHEKLPNDYERPFTPADESPINAAPPDHPATDSNLDEHQIYDEGITSATETNSQTDSNQQEKDEATDMAEGSGT